MGYYFDDTRSINAYEGSNPKAIISALANRYMGQNIKHGLYYRAFVNHGVLRTTDYRYRIDWNEIYPNAKDKDCVWAWSKFYSKGKGALGITVNCFGPMTIYVNDEIAYKSDIFKERYSENGVRVDLPLEAGWNNIVVKFQKTKAGFGGHFGTWIGKWDFYFLMPIGAREGQEGFMYTGLLDDKTIPKTDLSLSEEETGVKWYPETEWTAEDACKGQMARMFGNKNGEYAVGWTKGFFGDMDEKEYTFNIDPKGKCVVYIDKKEVFATDKKESFKVKLKFGSHDIAVKAFCGGDDWGYTSFTCDGAEFSNPARVKGTDDNWIYIGTFPESYEFEWDKACDMLHIVGAENKTYWRIDAPDTFVRPYNENTLFGRWSYPLGVTIYGLLHAALVMGSEDIKKYIQDHMQLCCDTLEYALWDKEQYGGATSIHNLLTSIDSLDDCGSFASALLEANKYLSIDNVKEIADYVGDYISNKQSRLPDGCFYRKDQMHSFHNMTMWADDLYMSVPFLSRYYKFTGDQKYADDAANQFFGFKERLFIPEENIMSHVYDFKYDTKTNVPWGRGNGWVVFSMTELLEVLPEDHPKRAGLIEMLNVLCAGYLKLQDEDGMWHQVLNDWESYPETSCTSMFIYAFSRGVRFGWLKEPEKYVKAVYKGWDAVTKTSVDSDGNVYGVCRGSEFAFVPDYYKYELGWNLNDTHGTGIVMLAGIEVIRLEDFLKG